MYTEYTSVELPLINTLAKLGWSFIHPNVLEASGRTVYDHIVPSIFKEAFLRINPSLSESDAKIILERLSAYYHVKCATHYHTKCTVHYHVKCTT